MCGIGEGGWGWPHDISGFLDGQRLKGRCEADGGGGGGGFTDDGGATRQGGQSSSASADAAGRGSDVAGDGLFGPLQITRIQRQRAERPSVSTEQVLARLESMRPLGRLYV